MTIRILQQRKSAAVAKAKGINSVATAADRDLTAEEQVEYDAAIADARSYDARIARAEQIAAEETSQGLEIAENAIIVVGENRAATDPKGGFNFVGEFMKSVYGASQAQRNGNAIDKRLQIGAAAPGTFVGEGSGQDGGFLIPPDFSSEIFTLSLTDNAFLPLTDEVNVNGNGMAFPRDETTPWGANGIRAYWQGESTQATATKAVIGLNQMRLKKLMALVPVSDEMLDDSSALASYLPKKSELPFVGKQMKQFCSVSETAFQLVRLIALRLSPCQKIKVKRL